MYSPYSLLRESVTGGELHRNWAFFTGTEPCFISPDEGPVLRHPRPPLMVAETKDDTNGAKGTPAVPSATTGPLPGEGLWRLPRQRAYLRVSPGFACLGEGPCSWLPSGSPQCVSLVGMGAAMPGSSNDVAT